MSFKSINDILSSLETQDGVQKQPFQHLLQCWAEVVGVIVAKHTQPISMTRNVLRVATSSAAWAQNLTFERRSLLSKLNSQLPTPLVDIRFSTAGWQTLKPPHQPQQDTFLSQHPSYLDLSNNTYLDSGSTTQDANTAFNHWAQKVQVRSQGLPLCPKCQCPTPPGELQRWGICSLCTTKQMPLNSSASEEL